MKTFLGATTGLMLGWVAGVASVTVLCMSDKGFMKFFSEQCGYRYES